FPDGGLRHKPRILLLYGYCGEFRIGGAWSADAIKPQARLASAAGLCSRLGLATASASQRDSLIPSGRVHRHLPPGPDRQLLGAAADRLGREFGEAVKQILAARLPHRIHYGCRNGDRAVW